MDLGAHSDKLKCLAETIDSYVECSSFISDNQEIENILKIVSSFDEKRGNLQQYFDELNAGLYDLSDDSDLLPCMSQDPNSCVETEMFKEKKALSVRVVTKTRMYVENPVFMESALAIADNEATYVEASQFLCKQFKAVNSLLLKFFPEEEDFFPSSGNGFNCHEMETFQNIRMPLVHILDFFCSKLQHKRVANVNFHDNVYIMFKKINAKYERLFEKTCHKDAGWCNMMRTTETKTN